MDRRLRTRSRTPAAGETKTCKRSFSGELGGERNCLHVHELCSISVFTCTNFALLPSEQSLLFTRQRLLRAQRWGNNGSSNPTCANLEEWRHTPEPGREGGGGRKLRHCLLDNMMSIFKEVVEVTAPRHESVHVHVSFSPSALRILSAPTSLQDKNIQNSLSVWACVWACTRACARAA